MEKPEFLISQSDFIEYIEKLIREDFTYIQALNEFCENYNIDPADIKKIIPAIMLKKIKQEAVDNKMLKKKYLKKSANINKFLK